MQNARVFKRSDGHSAPKVLMSQNPMGFWPSHPSSWLAGGFNEWRLLCSVQTLCRVERSREIWLTGYEGRTTLGPPGESRRGSRPVVQERVIGVCT